MVWNEVKIDAFETSGGNSGGLLFSVFSSYSFLKSYDKFDDNELAALDDIKNDMSDVDAEYSLNLLSTLLEKYYGKKVLIFLDEYDTPLQEAYIRSYWDEMTAFIRTMFNNTFMTNPSMERSIMTGITRVSKESIFSDLNNLTVITTTSDKYSTSFGFTEEEVFRAIKEQGYDNDTKEKVKMWYDGFKFGTHADIYNPWSITCFLDEGKLNTYWANTSGNSLVGHLIQNGQPGIKMDFEKLMNGGYIDVPIDEQIVFDQLSGNKNAIWSLLLASGYLKYEKIIQETSYDTAYYRLAITNFEVKKMFGKMIEDWFSADESFGLFVNAMFMGDTRSMNYYMNKVALNTFSYFDVGNKPSEEEPEKFYHGFVLGLMVDKAKDYSLKSNRESGFGRYDVVMEPKGDNKAGKKAVIIEFKVYNKDYDGESDLSDTVENALKQIEEKQYASDLLSQGIAEDDILKYGFAFKGKKCLIKMKQ